ncbi:MAG: hypothetical protein H7842_10125 [Gammaproteobacteria bacterium SHHR-1]|uniref:hypothetical protein n=1 Tax=Magnetovirga frankeli TaxID=947516 RepID=UPI0012935C02|nr:hypothetical protein D5125_04725 [gamma proteobacterium SS-5]
MHQHMRQRHEQWRKLMEQRREDMRRQMHQRMRCLTPDCPGQTATRPDAWREALETRREAWRERMQKRREQRHQWMLDSQIRPPALEGLGSSRSAEPATGVKKKTGTGAAVDAGQAAKTPDQEGEGQTRPQTETQAAPVEAPTPDTQPAIGELEADAQSAGAQRPPEAQTEGATKEQEAQSTEPGASSSAEDSAQEKGDAEPKSTSSRGVPVSLPRPIRV